MVKSSFFQLLKTLSNKELKAFYQFSVGVYATQKVQLRLLSFLVESKKGVKNWEDISMESAYQTTFQEKLKTDKQRKKLFNTLSDLNGWLKRYLIVNELEEDDYLKNLLLARVYSKRKLSTNFLKLLTKTANNVLNSIDDFWKPLKLMRLSHLSYFGMESTSQIIVTSQSIQKALAYLDQFSIQAKLRYGSELYNRQNILAESTSFTISSQIEDELVNNNFHDNDYIELYYWIMLLVRDRNFEAFEKIESLYFQLTFIDKTEEEEIIGHLNNFQIYLQRIGKPLSYDREMLFYKKALKDKLLLVDGNMTSNAFLNIVFFAIRNKDLDWVEEFIETSKELLIPKEREDVIFIARTRLLMEKKMFGDALIMLSKLSSTLHLLENIRRTYQIICLYELGASKELLLDNCSAFLLFLKRDKLISGTNKEGHINFIQAVQRIVKQESKEEISAFVNTTKPISYKRRLVDWIDRL